MILTAAYIAAYIAAYMVMYVATYGYAFAAMQGFCDWLHAKSEARSPGFNDWMEKHYPGSRKRERRNNMLIASISSIFGIFTVIAIYTANQLGGDRFNAPQWNPFHYGWRIR